MKLKAFVKEDRSKNKEPAAKWIEIKQSIEKGIGGGFYVFYFDDNGENYADGFGLTLQDAIDIARCDCGIKPEDWRVVEE